MKRVADPADPRRCKFSYPHEQCWHEAEPGCDNCLVHGGKSKANAEATRLYHLVDVDNRRRLAELAGHDNIKSLREEIGLLRILIEKTMNAAKSDAELFSSGASLNNMFITSQKLIKSCHELEQSTGELLSKQTVHRLAQKMCEIVLEELQGIEGYEEIIDRIANRLFLRSPMHRTMRRFFCLNKYLLHTRLQTRCSCPSGMISIWTMPQARSNPAHFAASLIQSARG